MIPLLLGLLGCTGVGLLEQVKDDASRPEDTVMVIVAARDLYAGVRITEEDLYAVEIPPRYLPTGVYLSPEEVVGKVPTSRGLANEFVRTEWFSVHESPAGFVAADHRMVDLGHALRAGDPHILVDTARGCLLAEAATDGVRLAGANRGSSKLPVDRIPAVLEARARGQLAARSDTAEVPPCP